MLNSCRPLIGCRLRSASSTMSAESSWPALPCSRASRKNLTTEARRPGEKQDLMGGPAAWGFELYTVCLNPILSVKTAERMGPGRHQELSEALRMSGQLLMRRRLPVFQSEYPGSTVKPGSMAKCIAVKTCG